MYPIPGKVDSRVSWDAMSCVPFLTDICSDGSFVMSGFVDKYSGDITRYLAAIAGYNFVHVELLVRGAFDELLNALIPATRRSINYDPLDGTQANVHEVIERVNTFSLLPGTKVIVW